MSRRATKFNKRDANEGPILKALARMGVEWFESGPLDGWIVVNNKFIPIEIKMPGESFTEGQEEFIGHCVEAGLPCAVWRSVDDAIAAVNLWRSRP